jgi:hypothetical protein
MRLHQQRQILDLLHTLAEAQTAELYADCQDCALQIGGFIESIVGEGTITVALLEEYCELLYKVSKGEQRAKTLKTQLYKVENSVKSELKPDKFEVAFLSYKASMSDSIESIYLAAKSDPDCDAYWIPVPYYERNPDGSFGTLRYEGADCYDSAIDCTDWQAYDIEARHPEVIFTFAPYDAGNYVTSVHPDYYCERLRALTDLLVYVPYFVNIGEVQEHFITVAGCIFAHRVILQSGEVRDSYVKIFKAQYGSQFGKPEDKFVALGSPKFDAVLSTKREIISDKKIVLYNTTVGAILQDSAQYLKKLRSVLDVFRNRNDVLLWWRPHPLSESTFESMRPDLAAEYRTIVAEYKASGYGILDEAPEGLHRAIAASDAYYGDWSSLVALYSVTGKPIMIQNPELLHRGAAHDAFLFETSYDDGDNIWFSAYWFNGLFKCDKTTLKAEYLGSFPGESHYTTRLFGSVSECGGKLCFAPYNASAIAVYDIAGGTFSRLELKKPAYSVPDTAPGFYGSIALNNKIWLIPAYYPALVVYDTHSGELTYIDSWVPEADKLRVSSGWWLGERGAELGGFLYFPLTHADYLLIVNTETHDYTLEYLNTGNTGHVSICLDDTKNLWLAPNCKNGTAPHLVRRSRGFTEKIPLPGNAAIAEEYSNAPNVHFFLQLFHHGGKIYAPPHHLTRGFVIDAATGEAEYLDAFNSETSLETKSRSIYPLLMRCWFDGGTLYSIGAKSGELLCYDTQTSKCAASRIDGDPSLVTIRPYNEENPALISDFLYYENNFIDLRNFINSLAGFGYSGKQADFAATVYLPNGKHSGEIIYEYCKTYIKET